MSEAFSRARDVLFRTNIRVPALLRQVASVSEVHACQLHEVALKTDFERFIAMDWNGNADRTASLGIDVVAAVDALDGPAMRFQQTGEFLARKSLQSASSIT